MKKNITICPKCHSELILDITYGYPSSEAFEDKSFFSGGCCVDDESPAYHCNSCGNNFGTLDMSVYDEQLKNYYLRPAGHSGVSVSSDFIVFRKDSN